jgi:hypothetical protein
MKLLVLVGAAPLLLPLLFLVLAALSGVVGGGAAGAGTEPASPAGVVGLAELGAAMLAVGPDPRGVSNHRIVTSWA